MAMTGVRSGTIEDVAASSVSKRYQEYTMDGHIFGQQVVNGMVLGMIYGLIAVGYSMVYGVIGMINFAHGDVYMISAYITGITLSVLAFFGVQALVPTLIIALLIVMLVTGVYGWVIERVAYRPLRG